MGLILQYWSCIPDKCHVLNKPFHNFEASLWRCYHMTMNNSHFTFLTKLTQNRCNVLISTSRRSYEFNVAVIMLYRRCHYNIHDMLWGEFIIQIWGIVSTTLEIWRLRIDIVKTDVVNLTPRFNVELTLSIVHQELNLLSNVEATLKHRFDFDVVASTLLQRFVLIVQRCDVITTLCVCLAGTSLSKIFEIMKWFQTFLWNLS